MLHLSWLESWIDVTPGECVKGMRRAFALVEVSFSQFSSIWVIIGTVHPKLYPLRNGPVESHLTTTMGSQLRFTSSRFPPSINHVQVQGG